MYLCVLNCFGKKVEQADQIGTEQVLATKKRKAPKDLR